jgi:hypothetical protein
MGASGITMGINYVFRFWFSGRVEKQEMGIGKETTDPLSSYDEIVTSKASSEQKPHSYIIFKGLLKSCTTQVLSFSLSPIIILYIPFLYRV